jgi:hypothetical protein
MGHRILRVTVAVQGGMIAGLTTGILAVASGAGLAAAALTGGSAFVVMIPLILLVVNELTPPPPGDR